MNKKRRPFLIAIAILVLASFLILKKGLDRASVVKIGLLVNLSGPGGKAGRYVRDGFLFEAERCGLKIKSLIGDYGESDKTLKKKIDELYDQGVRIFLGPVTSHTTLVALKHAEKTGKNLIIISPYSATSKLSGREDMFVRTCIDNRYFTKALIEWLKQNELQKLFVVVDTVNPDFTFDILDRLLNEAPKNHIKVDWVAINSKGRLDLKKVIKGALSSQAVLLLTRTRESAVIAQKLKAARYKGKLVATILSQIPELIEWGGEAVEGLTIISFVKPRYSSPKFKNYSKVFEKAAGYPPNARTIRAIEAMEILCGILEKLKRDGKSITPRNVLKQLTNRGYRTIMDSLFIDKYGDAIRPVYEIRVENGTFKVMRAILNEY